MKVLCKNCNNFLEVDPAKAGKVKYSKCKSVFRVEYYLHSPCPHCNTPLKVVADENKKYIGLPVEKTERRQRDRKQNTSVSNPKRFPQVEPMKSDTVLEERTKKKIQTRLDNYQRFSVRAEKTKSPLGTPKISFPNVSKIQIPNLSGIFQHASQPKVYLTVFTLISLFTISMMMKSIFKSDDTLQIASTEQPDLEQGMQEFEPQHEDEAMGGPTYLSDDRKAGLEDETIKKINSNLQILKLPSLKQVTSTYGIRLDPFTKKLAYHAGVDFRAGMGTKIEAAMDGVIKYAGPRNMYGNAVVIRHPNGYETLYGHLSKVLVQNGQKVKQTDIIGLAGSTGRSTGPHLHFELIKNGKKIDPLQADLLSMKKK